MGITCRYWKGAWWVFINYQGKRKAKRIGSGEEGKRAAKEVAMKIQARLALGGPFSDTPEAPTLTHYAATWLKTYAAVECKPRTQELYDSMLRHHILPTLGPLPLTQIKREQIRTLLAGKAATGLKRSTLQNMLAPLREMLNHAVQDGLIPTNPATGLVRRRHKSQGTHEGKRVEFLTEPELAHLLTTATRERPDHADLIATIAWTGMRSGEAFGLQWPDLDFFNGFLEVRRTVGYRKGTLNVGSPKSGKARRIDVPRILLDRLMMRYDKARETAALTEQAMIPWLFTNREGKPLDGSHFINRVWHPLLEKAGLRRITIHALRHTYASLLIMRGENLAYIKEQLGHSSIQVTVDLYGHLIPGIHRGAVDALAEATKCNPGATDAGALNERTAEAVELFGGPCRGRTYGPLIKSQLLYQLS